ncbi:putative tetratricopeptide-like helical domain superfamily [Helianthus anomalus]
MQAKGVTPTVLTYGILFDGMCENGECSDALVLFRSMGSNKLMKDVNLYNILIKGCRKCGKLDLAMDLFDELSLKGLKPNVNRTYTMMISVLCQQGLFGDAKDLLRKMEENGCSPNTFGPS